MQFNSTRNKQVSVSAAQAIQQGLSREGGLFVPTHFPQVTLEEMEALAKKGYHEIAYFVLSKYVTDFTEGELRDCINKAYTREKFETDCIAPLYGINNREYFLELFHGPTCAFKDMALQILPYLMTLSAKKTGETKTITVLVATSGDTGKAALEGFKDVDGTNMVVFYPQEGVSDIQKLQMVTQGGSNVFVCAVEGNFDDAQNGVKRIFTDAAYEKELAEQNTVLSSANSINFGRLVPQIVYYFSAYCDLYKNGKIELGDEINVVVPTGNFGNILAAYYAKEMGLPIHRFVCASNCNDVLTDFIQTGVYNRNRAFHLTASPSMDILISSNLERFLYELTGKSDETVKEYMARLATEGIYEVDSQVKSKMQALFSAGSLNDEETLKIIQSVFEESGYLLDTHTAVAKGVYDTYRRETGDEHVTVIAATASPYKFLTSVLAALKPDFDKTLSETALLDVLSRVTRTKIPKPLNALAGKERIFKEVCHKNAMQKVVSDYLSKKERNGK